MYSLIYILMYKDSNYEVTEVNPNISYGDII